LYPTLKEKCRLGIFEKEVLRGRFQTYEGGETKLFEKTAQ
jgi:hypothetical protein